LKWKKISNGSLLHVGNSKNHQGFTNYQKYYYAEYIRINIWKNHLSSCSFIIVHALLPSFSRYNIFHLLTVQSCFEQATAVLTPAYLFPTNILPSSKKSNISWSDHLDPIPPLLLYIKLPFPMNKQFSIDSFLDWEGLHWDFSSTIASPPVYVMFWVWLLDPYTKL